MLFPTLAALFAGASGQLNFVPLDTPVELQDDAPQSVSDEFTHPTLCDPSVKQTAGYLKASSLSKYFFWLFESKSDPVNDPLIMWLSGGPGCSSQLALFAENGPCTVNADGTDTIPNPYSWHANANALWVDQPAGTGFSTGAGSVHQEKGVGNNMYRFLQNFYGEFPQYQKNDFFIFGESYAGHYVPSISHKIWESNKDDSNIRIPLKGIGIGNGLTNPEVQYGHYAEMCHTGGAPEGGHAPGVCGAVDYNAMKVATPICQAAIADCNSPIPVPVPGNTSIPPCIAALELCNLALIIPYQASGKNVYDMRIPCEHGKLCYDFDMITTFLNNDTVQEQLGTKGKWGSCNTEVALAFELAGDWMKGFHHLIPDMLHDGIDVLIYAGDCDYICNWLGNKAWTQKLKWNNATDFNNAEDKEWQIDGKTVAKHRNAANFHFMQVFEAGHMVPMDKPAESLAMVNAFISGSLPANDLESISLV